MPAAEGSVSDKKGKPEVDRKKLLAKNVALADKAAKALGPLQGTATGVSKLLEKVEKSGCEIPEGIKQSKDDCMGKLETWATAARECINVHESTRELWKDAGGDLLPLTALPFEGNDVKLLLKQATEVQTERIAFPAAQKGGEGEGGAQGQCCGESVAQEEGSSQPRQ